MEECQFGIYRDCGGLWGSGNICSEGSVQDVICVTTSCHIVQPGNRVTRPGWTAHKYLPSRSGVFDGPARTIAFCARICMWGAKYDLWVDFSARVIAYDSSINQTNRVLLRSPVFIIGVLIIVVQLGTWLYRGDRITQ